MNLALDRGVQGGVVHSDRTINGRKFSVALDEAQKSLASDLLRQAQSRGLVGQADATAILTELGVQQATPVTITLNVTGDVSAIRGSNSTAVQTEVERVLASLAGNVGVTVQSGSVRVSA